MKQSKIKKLTIPQWATLYYIWMNCGIETFGKNKGTLPLQNLVKLKLVNVSDASWGEHKIKHWHLTDEGYLFAFCTDARDAYYSLGWDD